MVYHYGSLLLIIFWFEFDVIVQSYSKEKKREEAGETGLNLRCLMNSSHHLSEVQTCQLLILVFEWN